VTVTLSTIKTDYSADEDVLVNVTLSNIEAQKPVRILDWVNPCDSKDQYSGMPKDMSFFNISTGGGSAANYIGALIKRGRPVAKNYMLLLPGEQIICTVNIGEFYQFEAESDDDTYDIQYLVSGMQLSGPVSDGISLQSIKSNPLKVKVAARHIPRHLEGNLRGLQSGSNSFRGCTSSRQNSIRDARSQAVTAAKDATDCIASVSGSGRTRYEEWFGQFSSSRHNELKSGYNAIYARLKDASITFDCSCTA
jgi:peptidyl-Lys metalloendopeptidase